MTSGAAFCIGAKGMGEAWTPNENSDAPQARIKANPLDIGKTPNFALESPQKAALRDHL
jgi:hypothetical protein